MKINLLSTFYFDKNPLRQAELNYVLGQNLKSGYNEIILLVENQEIKDYLDKTVSVTAINIGKRALYNDYLSILEQERLSSTINIIANSDIFFRNIEEVQLYYKSRNFDSKLVLALSRWDWSPNGSIRSFLRPDSQDAWVFIGNPKFRTPIEYGLGTAGCDNRFAYDIHSNGYYLENPSNTIAIFHYHDTNVRNYLNDKNEPINRIPPPYKLIPPI